MSFFERIVPVGNVLWNEYTRETIGNSLLPENVIEAHSLRLGAPRYPYHRVTIFFPNFSRFQF